MNNQKAFTLIELLLVVVIIGSLAAMTAPISSRLILQTNVSENSERVKAQFRKAQIYSMSGKKGGPWGVAISSGNIVLFQGTSFAARTSALDETLAIDENTSVTGFTEVVFAQITGNPSATPTITITSGPQTNTLSINSQGIIQ